MKTEHEKLHKFKEWFDDMWLGDEEHGQFIPLPSDKGYTEYIDKYQIAYAAWVKASQLSEENKVKVFIDLQAENAKLIAELENNRLINMDHKLSLEVLRNYNDDLAEHLKVVEERDSLLAERDTENSFELILHRAAYKAIKEAGHDSPEELLAAYNHLIAEREQWMKQEPVVKFKGVRNNSKYEIWGTLLKQDVIPEFNALLYAHPLPAQQVPEAYSEPNNNLCALKSISDLQVMQVARAFWRRIYPYRNDYGIELPKPLPVEFMAHMATALMWADKPLEQQVVVPEGLEIAANYIEQKATDYHNDHGRYDNSTGGFDYPGDGREYLYSLGELAEEIRALSAAPKPEDK
jgi:hypothetical protein